MRPKPERRSSADWPAAGLATRFATITSSLGDKVGGIAGDGIKAGGDAAGDAIKDAAKDLAGAAAGKGLDAIKGDDHAPKSDGHGESANPSGNADNHESLLDKGLHALEDARDQAIHKATDIFEKATHDPQWLLNHAADAVKDHFGKGAADALGKLLDVVSHANGDANAPAHAADGAATGTTHSALTAAPSGSSFWDQAGHGDGHGLDGSTLAHALTQGTAASAVAHAHIPVLEAHPLVPSFGDPDFVESVFSNHASWSALNPQPLPPAPDPAGAFGGHDLQAALQNALHGISFSEMSPQLLSMGLDGPHAGQTSGAEAGIIIVGGHDAIAALTDSLSGMAQHSQPQPPAPNFDQATLAHSELPAMWDEFSHQLVI